ncbi:MAG: AmmeMemoRadiSam system radical SAM enzyme [Candidatus Moraniibacteriota bacterium]
MPTNLHEALIYSSSPSRVCKCGICPRNCTILPYKNGKKSGIPTDLKKENVGFCGTRVNIGGKLYAANYGRITSLAVDPVEKKPLYHFFPGESLLSFGSFGCNFRCPNCHNWEISQTSSLIHSRPEVLKSLIAGFSEITPAEIVSQAVEYDCVGVACTYNEPTVYLEFALEVMKMARKAKLQTVWVTNGYFNEDVFLKIEPLLNAVNVDLKSFDQRFYQSHCKGSITPVLGNLRRFKKAGIHLEITTLLIPGLNDQENNLRGIAAFIAQELSPNTPWHLIDFSSPISWQMQDWQSAGSAELEKAYGIGKAAGLKYIYSGHGGKMANTYCPHCGELNIKRLGYEIEDFSENGTCFKCGQRLSMIIV